MAPPRSAFGASPPGGRHRRTGEAGSVVAAWLAYALLGLALAGSASAADRTPKPVIEPALAGSQCVEQAAVMRRNHMEFLKHQRDDTVRGGIRGAKHSLKACIDCHASTKTASVAKAETNFCVSCHTYAAVKVDCFECHTAKSSKLASGGLK
jgi:predicted CXXCH cytochrome family protein